MRKKKVRRFAQGTTVTVEKSRAELERLVTRHGAKSFVSAWDGGRFTVIFELSERRIRFDIPAPTKKEFRRESSMLKEERRRWRALVLIVKAKLEMVAGGDVDLDTEFLAYLTTADGTTTVAQHLLPQLDKILAGDMPPLLPAAGVRT